MGEFSDEDRVHIAAAYRVSWDAGEFLDNEEGIDDELFRSLSNLLEALEEAVQYLVLWSISLVCIDHLGALAIFNSVHGSLGLHRPPDAHPPRGWEDATQD